jgi:DNA-binding transcriptional MerR regulator
MSIEVILVVITIPLYGFYVFFLTAISPAIPKNKTQNKNADSVERKLIESEDPVERHIDDNDARIIQIETEIASMSQRIDTYTLESSLFGALAFSGFVTLISTERPVLREIQALVVEISDAIDAVIAFRFNELIPFLLGLDDTNKLLAAITIETLICSMFFVSVIVSRLRFSEVLKDTSFSTQVARMYNNKEEETYNLKLESEQRNHLLEERLQRINENIGIALDNANELLKELRPIVMYMATFRNLGLLSFLVILITSAFLVSEFLALGFVLLSVMAYAYTAFDKWLRQKRLARLERFLRR